MTSFATSRWRPPGAGKRWVPSFDGRTKPRAVGMPVVLHAPDSDLTLSIHNFSKTLLGIETSDLAENQTFSIGSMFSNIFGGR